MRLELARALVKAEGWRVVKVPGMAWLGEYENGWNACRAAVLASEGGDNGGE